MNIIQKNQSSSLTANNTSLKYTPAGEINEEDNDKTMNIRSDQDENEDKEMNLYSELSTPDPHNATDTSNTALLIDIDDEIKATEKIWKTTLTPILIPTIHTFP